MVWFLALLLLSLVTISSSSSFNGGTYLALAGRDAVVMATDSRFSHHRFTSLLLGNHPRDIFKVGSRTLIGCFGLDADADSLMEDVRKQVSEHLDAELTAASIARVVANLLYEQGYLISPIVAGLEADGRPYLCSMDSLGASTVSRSFVVSGTANAQLHALCEAFYMPDLPAEELLELTERCLRLALQRDILSGGDIKLVLLRDGEVFAKEIAFQDV